LTRFTSPFLWPESSCLRQSVSPGDESQGAGTVVAVVAIVAIVAVVAFVAFVHVAIAIR